MKVEIEKQSEGTTKASSLATMGREEDAEMGKETAVATSRPQQGTDSATEDGGDGESDDDGLPMSRARCIALVATVTGAAFLNVSEIESIHTHRDTHTTPCIHTVTQRSSQQLIVYIYMHVRVYISKSY